MNYTLRNFARNVRTSGIREALNEDIRRTADNYVDFAVQLRDNGSLLGCLLMIPIEMAYSIVDREKI